MTTLTRYRGDTFADEIQVKSEESGAVVDISTGYSFVLTVNTYANPANTDDQLFEITGTVTDGPNGLVEFAPSEAQADNVGTYWYDIQMTDSSSRIRTVEKGKYIITQDITK